LGNGGSGAVYLIYPSTNVPLSATTGSPSYTVANGFNIYKFTSSGSFTI
jgi:hypothetical protein